MKAIELYKFIDENRVEIDWRGDELVVWIHPADLTDFAKMAESYIVDSPIECALTTYGYVGLDIVPICDYYDIDPTEIEKPATAVA